MRFPFFRRKRTAAPADPLAAFDALIDDLERQGAQIRQAAATLLAVRGDLSRTLEREARSRDALAVRRAEAGRRSDARLEQLLARDVEEAERRLAATREALGRTEADAPLLLDAGRALAMQVEELRTERSDAAARLAVDTAVHGALRERVERVSRVLAVEAARDEVERAHALAEVYREEWSAQGPGGPARTRERGG